MRNSDKNETVQAFGKNIGLWSILLIGLLMIGSCKKEETTIIPVPTENLALDSLVASKKDIVIWENIQITAYARGKNLSFKWSTNHGSMIGRDSVTVIYYGCNSCVGLNTVECKVSNEYGIVSDTLMINVKPE